MVGKGCMLHKIPYLYGKAPISKSASKAILSRMLLTLYATRPAHSRLFALGRSNVCLVGENPTWSVPVM